MTAKVVKTIKKIALFSVLVMSILSCETDIENLGTNIVENGIFDTQNYDSQVTAYNKNILKNRANVPAPSTLAASKICGSKVFKPAR